MKINGGNIFNTNDNLSAKRRRGLAYIRRKWLMAMAVAVWHAIELLQP